MLCGKSHDLDVILDAEEAHQNAKKKKGNNNPRAAAAAATAPESYTEATPIEETTSPTLPPVVQPVPATVVVANEKFHSAYFDAFMTGTVFSYQLNKHKQEHIEEESINKIYLIGKDFPLKLEKSAFTKYSPEHERQRALS